MIADFDDFCLWVYVIVDNVYHQVKPFIHRPGPEPTTGSDSELLAMALIGECRGWDRETDLLVTFRSYRHLFPHQPSQSRFNRRRRNLMWVLNIIRRIILQSLDVAQDRQCVIDSLPLPVVGFHLAPGARGDWREHGATHGYCASKKQPIFGYKLHTLMTLGGVILDFELAPASASDLEVGEELLWEHTDRVVVGDKGYVSAPKARALREGNRIEVLAQRRRNQHEQLPKAVQKAMTSLRSIVETVNAQLEDQFTIEENHAHSFNGLCARLYTKLTAHTICIYINRLLGKTDFLQIKQLAFPN